MVWRGFRVVVVLVTALFAATLAFGAAERGWFARPWQSEDGLPNNTIFALAQTPDGYLWLGTRMGLVRFDGVRFEELSSTNYIAPPNRGIIAMLRGRSGDLWLAMDRGALVRLSGRSSKAFVQRLPTNIPGSLAEDAEGGLWVGYRGGAVYRLNDGEVVSCTAQQGLPEGPDLCALATDRTGRIWFAKAGRVGVFANGAFQTRHEFERLPARLASSRKGGMWLCAGLRLSKIETDGKTTDFGAFEPERANTTANVLLEDREGAVWIGTSYNGLFRHDDSGFQPVETTHQEIQSLLEDREGNLWVGTFGGGLNRVRRRAVVLEGQEDGLPFPSLLSICQDSRGTIWAATQNGVVVQRVNRRWNSLPTEQEFPVEATCIAGDAAGAVWIGNALHGVYGYRDRRFLDSANDEELRRQTIHALLCSRNGDVWIGRENPPGILRLRGKQLRSFEVPRDCRIIRAMVEDSGGDLWAGTSRGNLFRISGDTLAEVRPRADRELASIRCLYASSDGAVWIGYAGWGIGRLKDGQYAEIGREQGLYDDQISSIVSDGKGWLWFSADKGLFKVREQELNRVAAGRAGRVRSIHYGRGEGLPSLEGNFGDCPNALRSTDGRLWFPMRTALAVVDPERLGETSMAPAAQLERVSVDDHPVAWYGGAFPPNAAALDLKNASSSIRIGPGHHRLDFDFTALSFSAPENIQFRYRLEGLEEDWNEPTTRRATYSRLPQGSYVFRVVACGSDGTWDSTGASLALTVTPFVWQTWWFRLSMLGLFTLSLAATVRYVSFRRLQRQLRMLEQQSALHKERARIAKDIHDDLGANLTEIALLGELAQQDRGEPEKAAERVGKISSTARQAIKSLDEIVWAVNPRTDTLAHLIDYAGQFALDYLRLAGVRCRLDLPEQTPQRELSTELRHNLFLVVKEALNNVVRHARATEVWFRAKATPEGLDMSVEDNGCGFSVAPDNAAADGLRNMQQRLEELGGTCSIESRPGHGTRVLLHLRWPVE